MTKELTPLEALEEIIEEVEVVSFDCDFSGCCDIIEKALKRLETYDALGLSCEEMKFVSNISKDPNNELKKLKAFEIIKKRFTIQFIESDLPNYYGIMQIGTNPIYIKNKEEYELLKEVLL